MELPVKLRLELAMDPFEHVLVKSYGCNDYSYHVSNPFQPSRTFFFSLVRRDSVMLAARSQGYHEAIYGYVGGSD